MPINTNVEFGRSVQQPQVLFRSAHSKLYHTHLHQPRQQILLRHKVQPLRGKRLLFHIQSQTSLQVDLLLPVLRSKPGVGPFRLTGIVGFLVKLKPATGRYGGGNAMIAYRMAEERSVTRYP
jgi:hypothetical protein